MALSEVHGCDKIARAIEDSFEFQAFSSDYIAIRDDINNCVSM
jgi:hypothetical protein